VLESHLPGGAGTAETVPARSGRHDRDRTLAARIAAGDRGGLHDAITLHYDGVFRTLRRLAGNDHDAEDLAQDVFLRLWRKPPDLDAGKVLLSTWLYRVATNLFIDIQRKHRPDAVEDVDAFVSGDPDAEDRIAAGQVARTVDEAIGALPARQRAALVLTYYEALPNRDAADALDVSVDALESLLSRARRTLKTTLAPRWREMIGVLQENEKRHDG